MPDDSRSVASSVIISELKGARRQPRTASTNNLVQVETVPSINDYYLEPESETSQAETDRLLSPSDSEGAPVVTNGDSSK